MLPNGKSTKYILVYSKQRKRKTSVSRDNMDEHWKYNVDWRNNCQETLQYENTFYKVKKGKITRHTIVLYIIYMHIW